MKSILCLVVFMCLVVPGSGCAAGRTHTGKSAAAGEPARSPAEQAEVLLGSLTFTKSELGTEFERADYGRKNPACWTMKNAPTKPRRRIAPLVMSGAAGKDTRLCYFEYVRRGTHDDILIKIYIFKDSHQAKAALADPYLQRKSRQLHKHGFDKPASLGNLVFFATASESNIQKAKDMLKLVADKLQRLGW